MYHSSSSGPAEGWELSEVVSHNYPQTFSQNLAFPPKMYFQIIFIWCPCKITLVYPRTVETMYVLHTPAFHGHTKKKELATNSEIEGEEGTKTPWPP